MTTPVDQWEVVLDTDEPRSWRLNWKYGTMLICEEQLPREVAVDAACEFMDRFMRDNMPKNCGNPGALMRFCADEAERSSRGGAP